MISRDIHHIQKDILLSLASRSPQRFSQLQPAAVPNNTFSYHLKQLLRHGYVTLKPNGYVATRKSYKLLAFDAPHARKQGVPTLLTALHITNSLGQTLLLRRTRQPFIGWHGIPSGLVHKGEQMHAAAQRELYEKTTLIAGTLTFAGSIDFQYIEESSKDIFVHAVAFIYAHKLDSPGQRIANLQTKYGTLVWENLDDRSQDLTLPEAYKIHEISIGGRGEFATVEFDEPVSSTPHDNSSLA